MLSNPKLSLIVAKSLNGVIGINGNLPWRLSSDLKFFKSTTLGKPVLMGRVTWESLPFPLPGRPNLVLTNNVNYLAKVLADLKDIPGPKILHCITEKGKGYQPAEAGDSTKWHAPGLFNKDTGEIIKITPKNPEPPKFQDVFGHTIVELAEKNSKIVP